jgi:hypothetical protein
MGPIAGKTEDLASREKGARRRARKQTRSHLIKRRPGYRFRRASFCSLLAKEILAHADLPAAMNRYLLFTYYVGRALGGMKDYLDSFESIDEALENILEERNRYYQIVDRDSLEIVRQGLAIFKDIQPGEYSAGESSTDTWEP